MEELQPIEAHPRKGNPQKFIIGGVVIVAAIIYLIVSSLSANVQYFLTVEEILTKQSAGELVHVPGDNLLLEEEGGLARALHNAVMDPNRPRLDVIYHGPIPDLLQNEAQAIITGEVLASGVFEADEILLKCPTKYEGSVPDQIETE